MVVDLNPERYIEDLVQFAVTSKASDIHLTPDEPPILRITGRLVRASFPLLTSEEIASLLEYLIPPSKKSSYQTTRDVDFSLEIDNLIRCRINAFTHQGHDSISIRLLSKVIPTLDQLSFPPIVKKLTNNRQGLILVTGPTGSGKSTTLAAMIQFINLNYNHHIITLEDPIEYVHNNKLSMIHQREIGNDSPSFASALRASLRQDPDLLLIGEMRDAETIKTAITAAEMGRLVFASLHTNNCTQTIDRITDTFPTLQQEQIRKQLSLTIQGIISQQLIPLKTNKGMIAALEILIATPAIRNLIREGKLHQIQTMIQMGASFGMKTMDKSLAELYTNGSISYEEALLRCADPDILNTTIRKSVRKRS